MLCTVQSVLSHKMRVHCIEHRLLSVHNEALSFQRRTLFVEKRYLTILRHVGAFFSIPTFVKGPIRFLKDFIR